MSRAGLFAFFACACGTSPDPGGADTDTETSSESGSAGSLSSATMPTTADESMSAEATADGEGTAAESDASSSAETTAEDTAGDSTTANGDGVPPLATMIFPGPPGPLPAGAAFPLVGGGLAQGEEPITSVELLVDDAVVASGEAVPLVWNPGDVEAGGMSSSETIGDTGWIEFVVPSRLTHRVIGLAANDTGPVAEDAYHRIYLTPNGNVFLRGFQPEGFYDAGDVFRIEVGGGTVRYFHDGEEIHSEARPDASAQLVLDVLLNARASLADVRMSIDGAAPIDPTWTLLQSAEAGLGFAAHWDSGTIEDGTHDFAVRVVDSGGDAAVSAAEATAVDNTAPTCAIVEPFDGQILIGTVDVVATASDAHLGTEAIFVDGMLVHQVDGMDEVQWAWNTALLANGSHTLRFDVYDDAWTVSQCEIDVTVFN